MSRCAHSDDNLRSMPDYWDMETHNTLSQPPVSLRMNIGLAISSGLVSGFVFHRIGSKYLSTWIPMPVIIGIGILLLFSGAIALLIGYRRREYLPKIIAFLQCLILYCLSLDLSLFGWQKILKLQMIVLLGKLDLPFSSLDGETLLWAFYRYSYPYTISIACLQLTCAYLVLFQKTRLLALLMMIPMLVNIIGLDYFYHLPVGVLVHAIVLLLGILCLLTPEFTRLKSFFLSGLSYLQQLSLSPGSRVAAKLSIIGLPIIFFLTYSFPDKNPQLTGKYEVNDLWINGKAVKAASPKDSVLTTLYMDLDNDFVVDFNDYRYRYIGTYQKSADSLSVHWRYPANNIPPLKGKLSQTPEGLQLDAIWNSDTLHMQLRKH